MEILIFIILIALSALFAASETALFSLRHSEVILMVKEGRHQSKLISKLKNDPHRLLVTLLSGNTVVNITVGSLATMTALEGTDSLGVGLAAIISTIAILLFGEIFPKSFAVMHNKRVAQFIAPPIYICYILFYPIATLFVWLEQWIRHYTNTKEGGFVSEEEIRVMAELGLEHGAIDHHERQMIENIFQFDDIPVGKIMTPKEKIEALNGEVPVEQIAYRVSQSGFSRFPVYSGSPDDYIGYVHTNDVMRVLNSDNRDKPIMSFITPLQRVEESLNIEKVFRLMTRAHSHMFLATDTGNSENIIGLVTMEDILEQIMGEIEDEGDHRDSTLNKR